MATPDMKKSEQRRLAESTFSADIKVPDEDEGIEELLKKDQRQLSDAERERVGDYLLKEDERVALSTFDPQRGLGPPMKKMERTNIELPTKVLKRAEEEPAEEDTGLQAARKRYSRQIEQQQADHMQQRPGQAPRTDTEFAALREINEEIENLQNRRNSSMNPERARQLEEEIQRLEERRSKMPGGRQPPSDMEDEGARTSYEDYLLRN